MIPYIFFNLFLLFYGVLCNKLTNICDIPKNLMVYEINNIRFKHSAPPLIWKNELQVKSLKSIKSCNVNNIDKKYGNIIFITENPHLVTEDAIKYWYSAKKQFDFEKKIYTEPVMSTQNLLQLIWVDSEYIGCSKVCCDKYILWSCSFEPPMNPMGINVNVNDLKDEFNFDNLVLDIDNEEKFLKTYDENTRIFPFGLQLRNLIKAYKEKYKKSTK